MKLIKLDKNYDIKVSSKVTSFLDTDYIYIPLDNLNLNYKKSDIIKKDEEIASCVYSPVSGTIAGLKKVLLCDGSYKTSLVIMNDFHEKSKSRITARKSLNDVNKIDFLNNIFDNRLKNNLAKENVKHIIVSGIDDEPYIVNQIFNQKENTKIILETVDYLYNIFNCEKASIVIKNTDRENIDAYMNFIGSYPNINLRMVDDLYLIGQEKYLIEYLNIKEDYIFLDISDILEIYENIKKKKPLLEKFITITGDFVKTPLVLNVKIGTRVKDILINNFDEDFLNADIFVNGLMKGKKIDIDNLIVTKDFLGLVVMHKQNNVEKDCIKCGKCINVCPIKSNPLLAYEKNIKVSCIDCGLCSYICPSFINLRKYLKGERDE